MPDTGERREIAAQVNAKENETIQEQKKLLLPDPHARARGPARKLMVVPPPPEADATGGAGDTKVPPAKGRARKRK
ncbi:MAG TPA: hypothetical protein VNE83_07865 [Terriglobales bacterium]|nr:hypothetical protein [Terriglobales bacterium]